MKATVKLYTTDGMSAQGYPVKLIVTHQKAIKRKTLARSAPADWDTNKELPRPSHPDYEGLYGQIMDIRAKAVRGDFTQLEDLALGMSFFEAPKVPKPTNFYDFAQTEIKRMRAMGREGNAFAYGFSVAQLQKFAPALSFAQVDRYLLESFKRHKQTEGLKNSSIRTYLYEIRAIYNTAVRLGICEDKRPFTGLFLDLPVQKRRARNEYLDTKALKKLRSLKGLTEPQRRAVDLSLLQFYLGGMDLVDVCQLRTDQLTGERIYLQREKLGIKGYLFDVAVLPQAQKIVDAYASYENGDVFPWRKDEIGYKTFRSTHNSTLKRLQKKHGIALMPNGGNLTSKVMRHTFATMAKFKGVDVDIIREIMGHERADMDTVYKDRYPEKVRDAAHALIVDF